MTRQTTSAHIAKISPPRLPRTLQRERLFEELTEALSHPVVWISGPAGSGKTTLVASYLEARKLPALWYHVDRHDEDLATFFHYLGVAARRASPRKRGALPHLTRGYLAGIDEFVRRFFEALCRRLEAPAVLVFDDCHQLHIDGPVFQVLRDVLASLPEGISAVFISRSEPPPAWARLRANQAMRVLGWEQLRLTPAETSGLCALLTGRSLPTGALEGLHAEVQGWVAGLVLLLEQADLPAMPASIRDHASLAAVFDYFAGEIFQRQDATTREFLLRTSVLSHIAVPVAEQLTGNPRAGRILKDLARTNFFTVQHGDGFEYHPLFRDFLRHRLGQTSSEQEQASLKREAGRLLATGGAVDAAAELFVDGEDWDQLAALVQIHARDLLRQGRYHTLRSWLEAMPAERLHLHPWMPYWLGVALQPFDLKAAGAHLEQAYRRFRQIGDHTAAYLAWTAAVDTCLYVWGDFKDLDFWLDELKDLQADHPDYPSLEAEARVSYCMLNALMRRRPRDPQIQVWAEHAESMLEREVSLSYRMMIGNTLLLYHMRWSGNVQRMEVVASIMRTIVLPGEGAPLAEITWRVMDAGQSWIRNDHAGCLRAVEAGFSLSKATGVHLLDFMLYILAVCGSLASDDLAGAEGYLERMHESLKSALNKDASSHYYLQLAMVALVQGNLPRAREHAELVLSRMSQSEAPLSMSMDGVTTAQVLLETGAWDEAEEALRFARRWGRKVNNGFLEFHCLLCEGELALARGDQAAAADYLRTALSLGRHQGYLSHPWLGHRRPPLIRLYMLALEQGIETDYVHTLIRAQRLVPVEAPAPVSAWPWPVRITTLGRFGLSLDGEALEGKRGMRGKPLELLQALVALGGEGVAEETLTDLIWPDTDGDAGHHALETTLYRLRKLIGEERAVVLHNGLLSLDRRYCWVDLWAVQHLLRELEAQLKAGQAQALGATWQALRGLYHGPFLAHAGDSGWADLPRERLQGQMGQAVMRLGGFWEARGEWAAAAEVYAAWLEQQPLLEELYRRLMGCYGKQGRIGEARAVFEACNRTLLRLRGSGASADTRALHQSLQAGEAPA